MPVTTRLATEDDLRRIYGSGNLLIGSVLRPKPELPVGHPGSMGRPTRKRQSPTTTNDERSVDRLIPAIIGRCSVSVSPVGSPFRQRRRCEVLRRQLHGQGVPRTQVGARGSRERRRGVRRRTCPDRRHRAVVRRGSLHARGTPGRDRARAAPMASRPSTSSRSTSCQVRSIGSTPHRGRSSPSRPSRPLSSVLRSTARSTGRRPTSRATTRVGRRISPVEHLYVITPSIGRGEVR